MGPVKTAVLVDTAIPVDVEHARSVAVTAVAVSTEIAVFTGPIGPPGQGSGCSRAAR